MASIIRTGLDSIFSIFCLLLLSSRALSDTSGCSNGCARFDIQYSNCYWQDGPAQANDTSQDPELLRDCCSFGGDIPTILAELQNCVSCNMDGLGTQNLVFYQDWEMNCGVYLGSGFQSALSVFSSWSDKQCTEYFSASVLPVISTATTVYAITLGEALAAATTTSAFVSKTATASASSVSVSTTSAAITTSLRSLVPVGQSSSTMAAAATATTTTAVASTTNTAASASPTSGSGVMKSRPEGLTSIGAILAILTPFCFW